MFPSVSHICRTANLFPLCHKVSDDLFVFLIIRLRIASHEENSVQLKNNMCHMHICRTAIFLALHHPWSPGWLIFQTCFLVNSPKKMWHLCTKKYLQQAYLQFFGSLHHPRSPATHSSFQSVRGYTKAWLTADLPSSSPRTSITVFPLTYPHQNPAPDPYIYVHRDGEGEARPFFMDKIFTVHQFRIPSEPHGCYMEWVCLNGNF